MTLSLFLAIVLLLGFMFGVKWLKTEKGKAKISELKKKLVEKLKEKP